MRKYSFLVGFVFSILIFSFVQNVPFAYAAQGDVGAIVDSLEYNTTIAITPEIIQVSGDTFAVVYEGTGDSGIVSKFTIDATGNIQNSDPDDDPFGSGIIATPKVLHVVGDKYLIVYESNGAIHGAIWDMVAASETSAGAQIVAGGTDPDIVKLSDSSGTFYYAIAYRASGGNGAIQTISVPTAGNSITPLFNLGTIDDTANEIEIVKIGAGKTAVAYKDSLSIGKVKIVNISDDGSSADVTGVPATVSLNGGAALDTIISNTNDIDFIHVTGTVYAVAWSDNSKVGKIETLAIASDASSVSSSDIGASFGTNVVDPVLIQTDEATSPFALLVAYHDSTNLDGIVKSFTITNTGTISAVIDSLTFDGPNGQTPSLVHRTGIFYAVTFQGQDGDGFVSSFNLGDDDSTPPTVGTIGIDKVGSASTGDADFAKQGDSVKLTFTTNETIQTPVVTFPTLGAVTVTINNISGNTWTATATIPSSAQEVAVTFTIDFSDLAGNAGTQANSVDDGSSVTVDLTAPTAAITYSTAGPYKSGDSVTITATFDEPVVTTPVPQLSISGANTLAATNMAKSSTTVYTFVHTVGAGDGTATVAMATAEDPAGNVVTSAPTSGATFTVDNTAPSFVDAFVSGTKSMIVNYNEDVVTSSGQYTLITVGAQGAETASSISGSTTPTILVTWTAATAASSGANSGITFSISGAVTDLAGNTLSNAGAQSISATADASTITTVTLANNDGDSEVEIALTDDTFIETIIAPAGTKIDVEISSFTGIAGDADVLAAGGTAAVFPASTITVQSDDATIIFPPSVEVGGFGATEIIEIAVSVKDPSLDAEFTAAFPNLNLANANVIEFGDPAVDLVFSSPVSVTIPGLAGTVFSIDSTGNTLEILACDNTVVSSSTAETFIATITGDTVTDGEACFVGTTIWTNHFSGFGGSGFSGGGGGGGDSSSPSLTTSSFSSSGVFGGILVLDPTQTVSENIFLTGEKVDFILEFYENSGTGVQHIELVTNIRDGQTIYDSDLWIEYNRGKEVIIRDSEGYWSDAGVIVESDGFDNKVEFSVVFKKEMETSDIIVRLWDIKRNSIDLEFENVIMVINDPGAVSDELESSSELETDSELESILPEPTPGISEPTPGISEPTPGITEPTSEVELPTKTWTVSQLSVLKQWGGYDVETASDMDVLSKFGIKGEKIPPYVKHLVKWILKDQVSQEEFVNALQYLKREGVLSAPVGKQSFDVNTTTDLEEFTLEKEYIDETIKFEFDDNKNSFYTQANLGDLEDKVRTLRSLANNLEIQNELASSNMEFQSLTDPDALINQRESEWLQNPRTVTPFMQSLMDNEAALIAKAVIEHDKENLVPLISIVITNAYGVNTAITEKTHDYVQSDEQWWDKTKEGGIYIMSGSGGEKYTGLYTTEISLAINDSQGNFIGIIKAVVNFEKALLLD